MILKSTKKEGQICTSVFPDKELENTIKDLYVKGYRDIHNAETGEKYTVCGNGHTFTVPDGIDPCDIPF